MSSETKGSEVDGLMGVIEASTTLRCSVKSIYNMVQKGLLKPVYKKDPETGRHVIHFRPHDVYAAATAKFENIDLAAAGNLAMRAMAMAEHNQSAVNALMDVLGFHKCAIPFDDIGVAALQAEAKEKVQQALPVCDEEIMRWSRILMQISEEYLELARSVTGDPEPWKIFMILAERMAEDLQESQGATQDRIKIFLNGARRHFRNTAYFYVRTKRGAALAEEISKSDRLDDSIINLMFLH